MSSPGPFRLKKQHRPRTEEFHCPRPLQATHNLAATTRTAFERSRPSTRQNRLNRQIDPVLHMPFRASAHQNGASCRSDTPEGLSSPPDSVNARSGRPACCNRVPPARTTANWRFGPSKKRQFPSISATFLTILSVFFHDVAVEGAFWRECDLERFSSNWPRSRRTGAPNACPRIQRRALD
jgi:hypothetical protein